MGAIDTLLENAIRIHQAKRNPNTYSLDQLRQLYPDQEVNDQTLLRGIEQEQQRINPNFRMPRETSQGSGVTATSPFTTPLAPGEDSSVSDALVNRYINNAPIKPIRPPSQEMWKIGDDGVPRPTGQSIPKGAMVVRDPRIEAARQLMLDAEKQDIRYGYQSKLEEMRQQGMDDRAVMQERGRNARTKDTKIKTHLWHNPDTGQMEFVSEEDVNAGKYQGWKPFNYKQDDSFLQELKKASVEDSSLSTGTQQPTQTQRTQQLDKARARELLRKMGYDVPQ